MKLLSKLKLDELIDSTPIGYPTGLRAFDAATNGLRPGKLYLLGGSTGDGKTSVMIGLACQMARAGHQVLYIGTEDDTTTIASKIIANMCGVVIGPQLGEIDKQIVQSTIAKSNNIWLERYEDSTFDLVGCVKRAAEMGIKFVFYDYLGAIAATTDKEWRQLEMLTDQLKRLALETGVGFFTASQLSITAKTDREKPEFLDERYLANSKGIARKVDVAFNLERKTNSNPTTLVFHMYKNRCGARAKFELKMDYARCRLYE